MSAVFHCKEMNTGQSAQIQGTGERTYVHHPVPVKEAVCSESVENLKYLVMSWRVTIGYGGLDKTLVKQPASHWLSKAFKFMFRYFHAKLNLDS
jgi:hypothetical protein